MPSLKKHSVLAALASALFFTSAPAQADGLKVVATFSIIADLAQNVGGERITLTTLVGPDQDAHSYDPRPADAIAIRQADIILANGLHLEGFLDRLLQASGTQAKQVELSQGARLIHTEEEKHGEEHGHDAGHAHHHAHHHHGDHDPHAWQSVSNARIYVDNIVKAFCEADAEGCPTYRENAASYGRQLDILEAGIRTALGGIPEHRRTVITSHDAFRYLGQAYGLRFLSPQGMSTESEASAAQLAELIGQIRQEQASALFVENISNPKLVEQIARETGARVGGRLYSDALSAADGPAATYIDMMQHNATTIAKAIQSD